MVRPFSSRSDSAPGLFDAILARGEVRQEVGDGAWLSALVEVETALARAQAGAGVLPAGAADVIASVSAQADLDIADISTAAAASGNPVVPLVERLRRDLPADVAPYLHHAATSQDILDSATMLVTRRALAPLLRDLRSAADAAAGLARRHRLTPMAGRTLLRQAVPTTFGLKAAGWMVGLDEAARALDHVRRNGLAAQFGGAAGTLAGLAGRGPDVASRLAVELGLADPVLPWHTMRTRIAALAGALGLAAGVMGKAARDVVLLAQDEVAEVREATPGGSSAMAHKRNAVAAVSVAACAAQAPGLVATLLAAMVQEHERAAGAWHAEWRPLRELLIATGSAAAWLAHCLGGLVVDAAAMRANLATLLESMGVGTAELASAGDLVDQALARRARS